MSWLNTPGETLKEKSAAIESAGGHQIPGPPDRPSPELCVVAEHFNGTAVAASVNDEITLEHFASEDGRTKHWFVCKAAAKNSI